LRHISSRVMRRSIVHALARLRVISSAEDGLARDSASLLGASGFTGQSSTLQHSVQQALDVGKGSGSVVQQWRQPNMHGRGTVLTSSLVVSDASSAGSTARCYCAVPGKTDSGPIHVAAVSSDHSSSSSGSREQATKVCIHPECGVTRELRHFKPKKAEVDGLSPLCDGCRYHMDTYKRLITRRGFSVTQATEKCKRRFDAPGRSCTRCEEHLPAAFFHQGQTICISCTRAYSALRVSLMVVPVPPAQQQCVRCQRTLPAARFHAHISASSGLCAHCKDCLRELNRESQQSIRKVPLPATMQTSVRRCTACQQVKPRSAFRKDATRANGLTYKCKACTGEYERMSRSRQPGADSPAQQLS